MNRHDEEPDPGERRTRCDVVLVQCPRCGDGGAATPVGKGGSAIAARFSTGLCTEIVDKSVAGA
ncbi:hypothetical protein C7S15_8147 [Burkholderia cepacia]|nr:hypothetical protein [Burkholderia cepacia]